MPHHLNLTVSSRQRVLVIGSVIDQIDSFQPKIGYNLDIENCVRSSPALLRSNPHKVLQEKAPGPARALHGCLMPGEKFSYQVQVQVPLDSASARGLLPGTPYLLLGPELPRWLMVGLRSAEIDAYFGSDAQVGCMFHRAPT